MSAVSPWWWAAAAAMLVAIFAGWRDWRRKRRDDLDRVGLFNWPTIQMIALIACAIFASVAFNA